jgi:excisionase family DNA binding protein
MAAEELFTAREICRLLKISRATLDRWLRRGRFPEPYRLSGQTRRWSWGQVSEFLVGGPCSGRAFAR